MTTATEQPLLKDIPQEKGFPIAHLLRISNIEMKQAKNGKNYIQFSLGDKSTEIKAKKWDSSNEEFERFKKCKVVFVTGKTDTYNNLLTIVCDTIAEPEEGTETEQLEALVPTTIYDITFLKKELWRFIQKIENSYIKELCTALLKESDVKEKLSTSIAAKAYHHNYKGGLICHIVRLLYLVEGVTDAYNNNMYPNGRYKVNKDVLIFGAFCHDLYKIREYSGMDYSDYGNLVPHLPLGAIQINRVMDKIPNFPEEIRVQLTHLVLAHHGTKEFGSPVTPVTVESNLLHYCDNMAAKVDPILEQLDALPDDVIWTEKLKGIESKAYRGGMIISKMTEEQEDKK